MRRRSRAQPGGYKAYLYLAPTLIVLGVFLFTTEPVRHQIGDAQRRVVIASGGPKEDVAVGDLRATHRRRITLEFAIVGLLLLGVVAL